ncbi:cytochrome P450 [Streptomyces racemochromogenes]|uniref:Cytochrome P450 n=1 Tax=Streptomyces racemochromogenes TaxID=67353 RepID=A0ABW7P706_9ACTN
MTHERGVPPAPGRLPVLGHLIPMVRDPLAFLSSLPAAGDVVEIRLGPVRAVVVCDPGLTHQVLTDDRTFDKGGEFIERLKEVIGDGVGLCPHRLHRRQRRLMQPAFHPDRMARYADVMNEQITGLVRTWRPGQVLDVYAEMTDLTANVLVATMFSSPRPGRDGTDGLRRDTTVIVDSVYRRMLTPQPLLRLPTRANRRYRRADARLHRTVHALLAERRASGVEHGDLLSALLHAQDEGPGASAARSLSDPEIIANVLMFLLAGTETTASALAWALHLVAAHPRIEHDLHAEVDSVLDGRCARHTDLPRLDLAGRIVTESLRLYPPGWFLTRTAATATRLGGHRIPRGTTVVYSPYLLHRRPDLFEEPNRFDPDRWLPDRPPPDRHSLIPFGNGSRKCIGDTFATTEATLALAGIASRWTLRHLPGPPVAPARSASLYPGRLRMRAEARKPV